MIGHTQPNRVDPVAFLRSQEMRPDSPVLDRDARLALAFTVAASVLRRHHDGELGADGQPIARDLPIGAVVLDLTTGETFTGFPQDNELGDPTAHAEVQAMREAKKAGVNLADSLVTTTFEPCPGCLGAMADAQVPLVEYVIDRTVVEGLGLIKVHKDRAEHIVAKGRAAGLSPYPALLAVTDPTWLAAGVLPWKSFGRDPISEKVTYRPFDPSTQRLLDFHAQTAPDLAEVGSRDAALRRAGLHIAQLVSPGTIAPPEHA